MSIRTTLFTATLGAAMTLCMVGSAAQAQEQPPLPAPAPTQTPSPQTPSPATADTAPAPASGTQTGRRYPLLRVSRPYRFQIGTLLSTQDRVRDDISDTLLYASLSADLAATRGKKSVIYSVYIDTQYGQNDGDPPINRIESFGLGLSARTYFGEEERSSRFYAGLGIGAYTITGKRDRLVDIPATIGNVQVSRLRYLADDETTTSFGGKAFIGLELDRRFFGEISFMAAGEAQDYGPTGAMFSAGVRF